jgi:hypothetical protein
MGREALTTSPAAQVVERFGLLLAVTAHMIMLI